MNNKSKRVAFGGVLLALNSLTFILMNMLTVNTVFFMVIASFFSAMIIIEFGDGFGLVYSIATIFMALLIINSKLLAAEYCIIFSLYGFIKGRIEKIGLKTVTEFIVKLIYADIALFIMWFIVKYFLPVNLIKGNTAVIMVIGYQFLFILYDLVYTSFIRYYDEKRKKLGRI